jgi:hypothetical protein
MELEKGVLCWYFSILNVAYSGCQLYAFCISIDLSRNRSDNQGQWLQVEIGVDKNTVNVYCNL